MKNRVLLFLSLPTFMFVGALIGASDTHALQDLNKTSTLSLISRDGSQNISVSDTADTSWKDIITNNDYSSSIYTQCDTDALKSFINNDTATFSVSQIVKKGIYYDNTSANSNWSSPGDHYGGEQLGVLIYFSEFQTPYLLQTELVSDLDLSVLRFQNPPFNNAQPYLSWAFLTISDSGTIRMDCADSKFSGANSQNYLATVSGLVYGNIAYYLPFYINNVTEYDTNYYVYYSQFPVTYPAEWDGSDVPGSPPSETTDIDYWVNFTFTNSTSQLIANYTNKITDPASSLQDPKWIEWKLYKDAPNVTEGENVCELTERINVPFDLNVACPDYNVDPSATYYLRAGVNPINNPHILRDDVNITFKYTLFVINFSNPTSGTTDSCVPGATEPMYGTVCSEPESIDFTQCFTVEFPFVDPFECADNFKLIFNLLTTGSITLPKWNFNPQCHSLNVLDEWLNLPNGYQVCPQIPNSVRSVTTPFVAFLLGIVTLGFINRHNRDVSGRGF